VQSESMFDRDQLRALYEVSRMVTASLDLDVTLSAILDAAQRLTGVDMLAILLLDDANELVIRHARGESVTALGERVRSDQGIVGRALRAGRPLLVPDILTETDRARPDLDAKSGLRTYLAAPLVSRGQALGAITVGSGQPAALSPTAVALIDELADQAAVAVTHARQYEALAERTWALQRAQAQLVQSEKAGAIGQLAHGIAHEINTPLAVIVSNLSVFRDYGAQLDRVARAAQQAALDVRNGAAPEAVLASLETALLSTDLTYILGDLPDLVADSATSADRVAAIVRSIATFARRDPDERTPVLVSEVLESAVTLAWHRLKQHAQVAYDLTAVPPVLGHASELTQVIVHLLLNAAAALEEAPGTVTIGTRLVDDRVQVTIADTGRGIAPQDLRRVFDPFFTTRPPGSGTGMGLAVCQGIVERHGGAIGIDSTPGRGTVVTVHLPAAD
jgi:signal transduction histidine kinase